MNSGPLVFLAAFFAMALSWLGFVLAPQLQIGNQPQVENRDTGGAYPVMREGLARQGEQVYRANGCYYCHTEQVRYKGFGADVERGWGGRNGVVQSVNEDYLYDRPVMLGSQRVGPDLKNIGLRQTNENILLLHLYDPRSTVPKSVMPPYRYLFEKRKLMFGQKASDDALPLGAAIPQDYEVVPTDDARALVAYLLSLRSDSLVFETPPFPGATNAAAAGQLTNAAAAGQPTNAPAAKSGTNAAPTNSPSK